MLAVTVVGLFMLGASLPVQAQEATGSEADEAAVATEAADHSLSSVLEQLSAAQVQAQAGLEAREARYADRLSAAQARLSQAQDKLAATEAEGARLERRFDGNKVELSDKAQLLSDKIGALKELFGVFQQNASDLIGAFVVSPTSIEYPDRDVWLEGFANRMKNASEVSSAQDIRQLWFEIQREITARGEIVILPGVPVFTADGQSQMRDVVRVGAFNLLGAGAQPEYLTWDAGRQQVQTLPRQPGGDVQMQLSAYVTASEGLAPLAVDPTGGVLLSLLIEKPTLAERIDQGGLVGYMILALGVLAGLLSVLKLLDMTQLGWRMGAQDRTPDQPSGGNPLGRLLLCYRQNAQRDPETLALRLHECLARERGRIHRFTIFLLIIAAVTPLMGLLGTVVGMINTFQAITLYGTGDPQTMAGGISQALITTVLGLAVAVPAVLLHALLSGRGQTLVSRLEQAVALLTGDALASSANTSSKPAPSGLEPTGAPA